MILTHEKFKSFTPKEIPDSTKTSQILTALSFDSKEKVDEVFKIAVECGGSQAGAPQDHGFMYSKSFNDPDGHIWEPFWMDMNAVPPQP